MTDRFRLDPPFLWVGERRWPVSYVQCSDFVHDWSDPPWTQHIRGCHVTFENGWTASFIWGDGTYSDNHNGLFEKREHDFIEEPERIEVMIFSTVTPTDAPFDEPFSASPMMVNRILDVLARSPSHDAHATADGIAFAVAQLLADL